MADEREQAVSDSTIAVDLRAALRAVAGALKAGALTHSREEWREHDAEFHIGRALDHLHKHEDGDDEEPHASHAAVRILFALQLEEEGKSR
jgi:hypothetical protein